MLGEFSGSIFTCVGLNYLICAETLLGICAAYRHLTVQTIHAFTIQVAFELRFCPDFPWSYGAIIIAYKSFIKVGDCSDREVMALLLSNVFAYGY